MHKYPTNLTDKQWQVIKNMLDPKWKIQCKLPPKTKRFCPLVLK